MPAVHSAEGPSQADLAQCVHCGLCLQSCPTYLQTGQETDSPRGRIHLIEALSQGRIEPGEIYERHIGRCLVCRACENVCPSGVPFGRIMEAARHQLSQARPKGGLVGAIQRTAFKELLPHGHRLELLARALRAYQRSGLGALLRRTGLAPGPLRAAEEQLPAVPDRFFRPRLELFPAEGQRRYRVVLFTGCVMPLLYPAVHAATLRVLRRNGCDVLIPRAQGCCGALHAHAGELEGARDLARHNVELFAGLDVDAFVVNAAGCGSMLKEYGQLLHADVLAGPAALLAARVKDVSEFLATIELAPRRHQVRRRVTIQDSCHLAHAQRIKQAPRDLLAAIDGLEIVELAHPDLCCGSAGLYSLLQQAMSDAILADRLDEIEATGADTIVTMNPGCQLQLERGLRQRGLQMQVRHVIEILDEAYGRTAAS